MKKFLGLAVGLVLVGAAIMPFTDASRDAYHTYLYQQSLQKRNRRYSPLKRVRTVRSANAQSINRKVVFQNLRYDAGSKRDLYAAKVNTASKLRPMSNTISFSNVKRSRESVVVRNFDPINLKMQTVTTDEFSVELPEGWTSSVRDGHFTVEAGDALDITIRRLDDACENVSFQSCAISISRNLNHVDNIGGKINSLSRITRLYQKNNRHLNSFEQTETFTESFLGTYLGKKSFITRYFVRDGEGDLYLLEAVASHDYTSEAVLVARQLFNSFRIIK